MLTLDSKYGISISGGFNNCIRLPDAYLESIHGREHGRAFLHENGRFFTDYFFHRYRGDS